MRDALVAWDCIGRVPTTHHVRVVGGRALYEDVSYNDDTPGDHVRLARLESRTTGLHVVCQWVDADTPVELVNDETGAIENAALDA